MQGVGFSQIGIDFVVGPIGGLGDLEIPFFCFGLPVGQGKVGQTFMVE